MWAFVKSHAGLLFSCLCLAIFAVSNVVTANSRTLFVLPLPQLILRLYDMFRSSGRLIWPVYYLLVLLALWGVRAAALALGARLAVSSKGLGRAIPAVALGLLLLVQGVDLSHVLRQKHDYFAVPVVPESYHAPENWDRLAQPGRVLYQLELNEDRPMALRAALAGMPSNYYLLARGTPGALQAHMAGTRQALENGEIPFGNAVFITKDEALATSLATVLAGVCEVFPCAGYTVFLPLAI